MERLKCGKREPECVDSEQLDCLPVVVKLEGIWEPREAFQWDGTPCCSSVPPAWGAYPHEKAEMPSVVVSGSGSAESP